MKTKSQYFYWFAALLFLCSFFILGVKETKANHVTKNFGASQGGALPGAQTISVGNITPNGGQSMAWTSSLNYTSGSGWLSGPNPASGSAVGAGSAQSASIQPNTTSLPLGTYTATITFTNTSVSPNTTHTVDVIYTISSGPPVCIINTLTANGASPLSVTQGTAVSLSWTTSNCTSGTITAPAGSPNNPSMSSGATPIGSGSTAAGVISTANTGTTTYTLTALPGSVTMTVQVIVTAPTCILGGITFTANGSASTSVVQGSAVTLAWTIPASCASGTLTASGVNDTGLNTSAAIPSGTFGASSVNVGSTTYTLTVQPGSLVKTVTVTVTASLTCTIIVASTNNGVPGLPASGFNFTVTNGAGTNINDSLTSGTSKTYTTLPANYVYTATNPTGYGAASTFQNITIANAQNCASSSTITFTYNFTSVLPPDPPHNPTAENTALNAAVTCAQIKLSWNVVTAPNLAGATTGTFSSFTNNMTFSHNNSGDYLLVDVAQGYSNAGSGLPASVTFNGTALTKIAQIREPTYGQWLSRWRLIAPASGTYNIIVTYSVGSTVAVVTARSFAGVNQTTPEGSSVTNSGVASLTPTVTVSSAADELVVDAMNANTNVGATSVSVGSGQVQDSNSRTGTGGLTNIGATSHETGTASVVMNWTLDSAAWWTAIGTSLKPAPVAGGGGSSWGYSRSITIDNAKVPNADQTNFPVMISGTFPYLATVPNGGKVQNASGYDIAFFSDSALTTQLKHETEQYTPATGQVVYWVKVPTLSTSSDTVIYIAYGNSSISSDQSDKNNVWDSNFKSIWHMNNNAASTTVTDSTSNNNTGTAAANTSTKTATGKIGNSLDFNGSSDYIRTTNSFNNPAVFTIATWFKTSSASGHKLFGLENSQSGTGASSYDRMLYMGTNGKLYFGWWTGGATTVVSTSTLNDGNWHYAVATHNGSTGTLYIDGISQGSGGGASELYSGYWRMGSYRLSSWPNASNGYFPGTLDEVQLSTAARSANWIVTEYNNQNSPSTFYAIGSEQAIGGGGAGAADSYNLYRSNINVLPGTAWQTGVVTNTYTDTTPLAGSSYYWVQSVNVGGTSVAVLAANSPITPTPCIVDFSTGDKVVSNVNSLTYTFNSTCITSQIGAVKIIKHNDVLKFSINVCNTGTIDALTVLITDDLTNTNLYNLRNVVITGGGSSSTVGNITTFNLGTIPKGTKKVITFDADVRAPVGGTQSLYRFRNIGNLTYTSSQGNTIPGCAGTYATVANPCKLDTGFIVFYNGLKAPVIKEVSP